MNEETITIKRSEYDELVADSIFLNALRNAGVDNWEWYDEAVREYQETMGEDE